MTTTQLEATPKGVVFLRELACDPSRPPRKKSFHCFTFCLHVFVGLGNVELLGSGFCLLWKCVVSDGSALETWILLRGRGLFCGSQVQEQLILHASFVNIIERVVPTGPVGCLSVCLSVCLSGRLVDW